jgi:Bacterial type II secretion system protein G.
LIGCRHDSPEAALRDVGEAIVQHDTQGAEELVDFPRVATDVANEYARRLQAPHDAMADIRMYATAFESLASDELKYPTAKNYQDLVRELVPKYAESLPTIDPWGTPYCFNVISTDYRIASAGADRKFENGSCIAAPPVASIDDAVATYDLTRDVLYGDGMFVQYPIPGIRAKPVDDIASATSRWRGSIEVQLRRLLEGAAEVTNAAYEPSLSDVYGLKTSSGWSADVTNVRTEGKIARASLNLSFAGRTNPLIVRLEKGPKRWRIVGVENLSSFAPQEALAR